MKVLWITNYMMPAQCAHTGNKMTQNEGWVRSAADMLMRKAVGLEMAFATVYDGSDVCSFDEGKEKYYLVPSIDSSSKDYNNGLWKQVYEDFCPEVVHIHGTEFAHGLSFIKACPQAKTVVSLQGVISACSEHHNEGLTTWQILKNITLCDIVYRHDLFTARRSFKQRGEIEKETLKETKHVIGRTRWDKAQIWAINPQAKYHFCNETLRSSFYNHKWDYYKCQQHSIFVSQATYPLKGLHMLLYAMPLILREYPDAHIYVAGNKMTEHRTLKQRLTISGYGKILLKIIQRYHLESHVTFVGKLNEEEMCRQYLSSNVYVNCSSIENSPNSVGEAQLLGVPCVASYVGGTSDMIPTPECGTLYAFNDKEMLARCICDIFRAENIDNGRMREEAFSRHNAELNAKTLISIYEEIINSPQ